MKPSLTRSRIKVMLQLVSRAIAKEQVELSKRRMNQIESMSRGRPITTSPALRELEATHLWLEKQLRKRVSP